MAEAVKLARHFVPSSASSRSLHSIPELKHAIPSLIADTNAKPKPFILDKRPRQDHGSRQGEGQVLILDPIH